MKRRGPKLCPPLKFVCERHGTDLKQGATCRAFRADGSGEAGRIELAPVDQETNLLAVSFVRAFVEPKQEARCGVGTRLYEQAMSFACSNGLQLSSDTIRTRFSERFWKKQVEKGRAECLYTRKRGERGADMVDENLDAMSRRWRCRRYAMKSCPERIDLSGATKKIAWREPIRRKRRKKA